ELITNYRDLPSNQCIDISTIDPEYFGRLQNAFPNQNLYKLLLVITQDVNFVNLDRKLVDDTSAFSTKSESELKKMQHQETVKRYQFKNHVLQKGYAVDTSSAKGLSASFDRVLTHKVWGYVVFFLIMLLIFQAIYDWSSYPMDFIDSLFASFSEWAKNTLPPGTLTNLIAE